MTAPVPLPRILAGLTVEPGRPRLTWYGPDERVELSGHVLDNWVTKTANLLVEEYQAGPGTRILLDLPAHWQSVVWAMAVWRVGACVVLTPEPPHDLAVTDRPQAHPGSEVVAVALPALARQFPGPLPAGAVDAAAAVASYGDVLTWMPEPDRRAPAIERAGTSVAHDELAAWARGSADDARGTGAARLLIEPAEGADLGTILAEVLASYLDDGSVVLCAPSEAVALAADPERRQRLIDSELVTATTRVAAG